MVLTLWAVLLAAASTPVAARTVVVAETMTPPNMVGLGAQLARSVEQEARDQGRPVIGPMQLRQRLGEGGVEALAGCELDPACASRVLRPLGAGQVVLGALARDPSHYRVRFLLLDLQSGRVLAEVERSILIASRRLKSDVAAALPGLLRGEREATGTLVLAGSVAAIRVRIDDADAGVTPLTLTLKPGRHRVRAEKEGHYPVDRLVDVEAGALREETLRLTPLAPVDAGLVEIGPSREELLRQGAAAEASARRLELAGVLAGTSLVALVTGGGLHLAFEREELPLPARSLQHARNVALGVGATAAVAAGLVWLWESSSGGSRSGELTLVPQLLPSGGGVGLSGRLP